MTMETKNIAMTINHFDPIQLIDLAKKFADRFHTRTNNASKIIVFEDVTYSEFIYLLCIFENHNLMGKMHIVDRDLHGAWQPHEDILITYKS